MTLYETPADLAHEQKLAAYLEGHWRADLHKLPIRYNIDFIVTRGDKPIAVVEFKRRALSMSPPTYPTIFLSTHKLNAGISWLTNWRVPFFFIVQDNTDSYFQYRYDPTHDLDIVISGRTDRNDSQDIEPTVHIPTTRFRRIGP